MVNIVDSAQFFYRLLRKSLGKVGFESFLSLDGVAIRRGFLFSLGIEVCREEETSGLFGELNYIRLNYWPWHIGETLQVVVAEVVFEMYN